MGFAKGNQIPLKHGMWGTRVYSIWNNMKNRCDNTSCLKTAKNYHDRGINYCLKWASFEGFYEDMGSPPSSRHTLDRINGDEGYYKKNCRWATYSQQNKNRRPSSNSGHKHIHLKKLKTCTRYYVSVKPLPNVSCTDLNHALFVRDTFLRVRENNIKYKEGTMIPLSAMFKKTKNLGDYNSETFEVTGDFEEGESPLQGLDELRKLVYEGLGEKFVPLSKEVIESCRKVSETQLHLELNPKKLPIEEKKNEESEQEQSSKSEEAASEEPQEKVEEKPAKENEERPSSEEKKASSSSESESTDGSDVKEEEEGKTPNKKKRTTKASLAAKYDNKNEKHRALVTEIIVEKYGAEWREDKTLLSKISASSRAMVGEKLVTAKGLVDEKFKASFFKKVETL